jgi:hypothetical protein
MVDRPGDPPFQPRLELALNDQLDATAATGAGRSPELDPAAGLEHIGLDDGADDAPRLRPLVAAPLPEQADDEGALTSVHPCDKIASWLATPMNFCAVGD